MQERKLKIAGGSLYYEIRDKSVRITGYAGNGSVAGAPGRIEGYPVTAIGKKAFLSKKRLRRVLLPDSVEEVEDWSFAYCDELEEICFPRKNIRFGKAVFLGCGSLRRIAVQEPSGAADEPETGPELSGTADEPETGMVGRQKPPGAADEPVAVPGGRPEPTSGTAELLAAAVTGLEAGYLLDISEAGSREWLEKWDSRLAAVLHVSDREGYSRQVLCGEEDYGSTDLEAYESGRRKNKVRLALLRRLFDRGLSGTFREALERYLRAHSKGCESEETWRVILEEHGDDRAYYGLFAELGCVTRDNLDGILADIGEAYPEMKAYFLRYGQKGRSDADFFAGLEL